jgi:hypothetical protein
MKIFAMQKWTALVALQLAAAAAHPAAAQSYPNRIIKAFIADEQQRLAAIIRAPGVRGE